MDHRQPQPPRRPALQLSATTGIVVLNLLALLGAALFLWSSWTDEINGAQAQTLASARLLERAVAQTLDKAALATAAVASHVKQHWRAGHTEVDDLWQQVDGVTRRIPELQTVAVFDAQGRQVCGQPAERCRQLQVADRAYFQLYRANPQAPTQVFGPLQSRLDGAEVLIVAQALLQPDGRFGGVVAALLPTDTLRALLRRAQLERRGAVNLRTQDMALMLREPPLPAAAAAARNPLSDELRRLLDRSPQSGVYRASSGLDGVDRINAYQRLDGWPLYVLLGTSLDDVLQQWWRSAVLALVALVVFGGVSVMLVRALRAQAASQARAGRLYDEAPCGYHTLDAQGRYLTINRTELDWLGVTRAEAVGRLGPPDFTNEEGRQTFATHFPLLKAGQPLDNLEIDLIGRAGPARRVAVNVRPVHDEQGRFVCSNAVMYDISPLHDARLQLQRLADEQAHMLDTDLVGIAKVHDGCIVWANRGLGRLLGHDAGHWPGLPVQALFAEAADFERADAQCRPLLRAGQACRLQAPMRHHDGSLRWMDLGAAPLDAQGGDQLLMLVDITSQRQAEASRVRAAELKAQNDQLRETSRLKDEIVANLSHELRTPLNGVLGFAQLLAMPGNTDDPVKSRRYLAQIDASGRHLLQLIDSLLDFARLEAGKLPLNPQHVNLPDALHQVVDMLQAQAGQQQVLVDAVCDPALTTVHTDPLRLRQVLAQLLDNAIKFSRPGGHVQLRTGPAADGGWQVEVEDHGIGIAPQDMDRLFSPFEQLSSGSTKTHGGAGLGLAFVRRIARAMGGDVRARSEPGRGSVFTLRLPDTPPARQL